jgi:kumamolisin
MSPAKVGNMKSVRVLHWFLALALIATTSTVPAADIAPRMVLSGHTLSSEMLAKATPATTTATSLLDEPMLLTIVLRRTREAAFTTFLDDLHNPDSLGYRKYLTAQQISDKFGPTQEDYDAVSAYFVSQGFRVVEESKNRMTLTVTGSRAAAEAALSTRISDFSLGDRKFFANESDPELPAPIGARVQSIVGLSNLARPTALNTEQQHQQWEENCKAAELGLLTTGILGFFLFSFFEWPVLAAAEGGVIVLCLGEQVGYNGGKIFNNLTGGAAAPGKAARASDFKAGLLPSVGLANGSGQTIGLVQFDTFQQSDISDYLALLSLPANLIDNISEVHVNGGAPLGNGANEVLLDLTEALTIAPGAKLVVYDAPLGTSFQSVFNAAINGGSTIISNSWAYCEDQTTLSDVMSIESLLQSADASGISVFSASGDTGGSCLDGSPNTVVVPASAPSATAVGGSSAQSTSGLTYGGETWWNGSAATPPSGQGGFGVSRFFSRPSYQDSFNASTFRSIPDVVSNADPAHGVVICQAADGGCPSGKWYGGTSMTAPAWAAYAALLNQALGANMGAANARLYSAHGSPAFHTAASMGSDFAHVGLGSPNLVELYLQLSGQVAGVPDAGASSMVEFVSGAVSGQVPPSGYPADGVTEVIVRVQLVDANFNTVHGKSVSLAANVGSHAVITPVNTVSTVDNGTAVFKLTDASFENVTLTATDTTDGIVLSQTSTIPFAPPVAASASIGASPNIVLNDGVATTTITVTLKDALARPSPGKLVQLAQGNGRSIISGPNPSVTDASGQIQFTAADLWPEAVTYTAVNVTDGNLGVPGSAMVTFGGQASFSCVSSTLPSAAPGYSLTAFATGFVSGNLTFANVNWGCRGASQPAFASDGSVYATDFIDGGVFKLPMEGGAASSGNKLAALGPSLFGPVVGKDGKLYAARGSTDGNSGLTGAVVELDPVSGGIVRTVMPNITCPTALAVDPLSGDLFTSDSCFGSGLNNASLWRIMNPASPTPTLQTYATLPGTPTGWISIAPDGTIYMPQTVAGGPGAPVLAISGTDKPFPPTLTPVPGLTTVYWITVAEVLASGAAKSLVVYQQAADTTYKFMLADITTDPPTLTDLILSGASSGMVGPDGCLYFSGVDTIYKLAPASGGCGFAATSPAPALRLTPTSAAVSQGSQLALTAQFTNLAVPAGTAVRFLIGDANRMTLLGITDASGSASVAMTGEFVGIDGVLATATVGAVTYLSNVAQIIWSAGKHATALSLNTTPSSGPPGQPVALRATLVDTSLTPAAGISGASIHFTVGAVSCNGITDASGNATCSVTPASPGNQAVIVTYAGDASYLPAAAAQTFQVVAPATTTLATSGSPVQVGSPFTLTATVSALAPTGTASFRNELIPLPGCTFVPLTGSGDTRTAQCTVTSLGVGSYALSADYSGDGGNLPSTATLIEVVSANGVAACGGFSDVNPASPFCANVEWLSNRRITLGCSAGVYCPNDSVIRLSMAAFMNRLGTAGTPVVLSAQAQPGTIDPDASPVVCQTTDFAVVNFPRRAMVDAILSGEGAADVTFVTDAVASFDAGATWAPLASIGAAGSATTGHWGNVRVSGVRDLDVGQTVRFGVRVGRGGLAGTGGLMASRCNLRTQIGNRVTGYSPF